ncbi:MAG: hypothetical protein KC733_10660, partial [Candidatus Omnitrophica bacterium]|nr:hypothetical protein [Candidatus Omnitrophota bacterium]
FYMGVGSVKSLSIYKLLESDVKPEIRRASLILLPLFCSKKETVDILENHAKDLNVAVSRMANYLLSLINNEELAQINLKKFHGLNFVYLGDQIWRLWFIGFNSNKKIREALLRLLKRINEEYRNYSIIFLHIKTIKKRIKLDKQIENT